MGVDPGLVNTGVGVIQTHSDLGPSRQPRQEFCYIHATVIKPPPQDLPQRLLHLFDHLTLLLDEWQPEVMAVEDQFYGINAQTAFKTGQARGAALLAAARRGIPVTLYPPARVKLAVVGNGRASKEQVQHMVRQILAEDAFPDAWDCSDALAIALCHAFALNTARTRNTLVF